jgi:hypothetical protein
MAQLSEEELDLLRAELDRAAIRDALFRYCRGVDRADEELMASVYHPDAIDEHGPYNGPSAEFAALTTGRVRETVVGIQHSLQNMLVEIDGDIAWVETYFQATYRAKADPDELAMFGGRYLDRFERRDGRTWLIARRKVVNDWSSRQRIPIDRAGASGYTAGCSDGEDALYATRDTVV